MMLKGSSLGKRGGGLRKLYCWKKKFGWILSAGRGGGFLFFYILKEDGNLAEKVFSGRGIQEAKEK